MRHLISLVLNNVLGLLGDRVVKCVWVCGCVCMLVGGLVGGFVGVWCARREKE